MGNTNNSDIPVYNDTIAGLKNITNNVNNSLNIKTIKMSNIITKIITKVETDVTELFNAAEGEYLKLAPEVRAAAATASGIIAIVNKEVSAVPSDVWALIQTKYPNVSQESVTAVLIKANNVVNGANALALNATFDEALAALNAYLQTLSGNVWITVIKAIVAIAVDVLTPGTVIQKVELVLEYIYQNLVKPHLALNTAVVEEAEVIPETPAEIEKTA